VFPNDANAEIKTTKTNQLKLTKRCI